MSPFKDQLQLLAQEPDTLLKRARFVALLSREMERRGGSTPIIVGGEAVELYTQGNYTSGYIDLKATQLLCIILEEHGFRHNGSGNYYHAGLDIYVDWLGPNFDIPGQEETAARAISIHLGGDDHVKVIGLEDLIVDRLNAAKHARDTDSRIWAKALCGVARKAEITLDLAYLKRVARFEDVEDELDRIIAPETGDEDLPH